MGDNSGSREPSPAVSALTGFDPGRGQCPHEDVHFGWDHNVCQVCRWVSPDTRHRRGTAAEPYEWFPSMDAFAHFKRTGVRSWQVEQPTLSQLILMNLGAIRDDMHPEDVKAVQRFASAIEARSDSDGTRRAETA